MRSAVAILLSFAFLPAAWAAQPQFWDIEGSAELLSGDLQGLSLDANGRLRLAPAAPVLYNPSCPYVWTLAKDGSGAVYAGTGNDGKVFRIVGKESKLFFSAPELEVHAIAVGKDGRVYVASSPDGKVYVVDKNGESKDFFDPEERYIWALAFDPKGNLIVATGDQGKVYRVDAAGKGTALLQGPETHIISLAVDSGGRIYAGSSPGGILYRIEADGKVSVLQDTPYREIKAIALGSDGSVYAAVLQGKDEAATPITPITITPLPSVSGSADASVTVTETVVAIAGPTPVASANARTVDTTRPGQAKGAVLRVLPSGETDTLWSSADEMPHALLRVQSGLFLGTGNKGKLYLIADDHTWTMVTTLPVEQITALESGPGGKLVLATSNPGNLYEVGGAPAAEGTFVSKVKDTEAMSSFGRLHWHADTPAHTQVRLATRSGNTGNPDDTWSAWSAFYTRAAGETIASPSARFLQVKVVLTGTDAASPVVDEIGAAFLQRNLRPQVTSLTVHPPGEVYQKALAVSSDTEILGLDTPLESAERPSARSATPAISPLTYSRKSFLKGLQTFSWKAEDPNGDTLVYDVLYRPAHDTRFRPLRKGLTDTILVWDTTTVPNGRYVIRVVARDSPSNPDDLALSGDKESTPFNIDNTPPIVTATATGRRIHAVAKDDSSIIRRVEYSVDGARWEEVHPVDGINDSLEETYDFTPRDLAAGPHVVVIRATDLLGNASVARVELP